MNKDNIINYLDKQFHKHKIYECMPENEVGYEYVPRESLSKIVDGLVPLVKTELKKPDESIKAKLEEILLDISVDIQKELLRQCQRSNCDDLQTDTINENTIATFELNKQKYLRKLFEVK